MTTLLTGLYLQTDMSANQASHVPPVPPLPSWLYHSNSPSSPSVTLTLSTSTTIHPTPESSWLPSEMLQLQTTNMPHHFLAHNIRTEILHSCKELEESHRLLESHKKEASWRLRRVELLIEYEKTSRKRQKTEEIDAQIKAIKKEEKVSLERIETEYREQLAELTRESEAKELKLNEQWGSKHLRLAKCLQYGNNGGRLPETNTRRM